MAEPKCAYVLVDFETTGLNPETDYPIEIGALFLDENFVIINTLNTLIYYSKEVNNSLSKDGRGIAWKEEYEGAYKIHGITISEWLRESMHVEMVAEKIQQLIKLNRGPGIQYPKLMSDNIVFETGFMKRLLGIAYGYSAIPALFHYHGYDTGLLFRLLGIQKLPNEHRAMRDVSMLYVKLLEAMNKLEWHNIDPRVDDIRRFFDREAQQNAIARNSKRRDK